MITATKYIYEDVDSVFKLYTEPCLSSPLA